MDWLAFSICRTGTQPEHPGVIAMTRIRVPNIAKIAGARTKADAAMRLCRG
jgi:hypothetical protein